MRRIEIIEEPRNQRPWVAVDSETKKPVIRMQRLETLLRISSGMGWEIVTANRLRSQSGCFVRRRLEHFQENAPPRGGGGGHRFSVRKCDNARMLERFLSREIALEPPHGDFNSFGLMMRSRRLARFGRNAVGRSKSRRASWTGGRSPRRKSLNQIRIIVGINLLLGVLTSLSAAPGGTGKPLDAARRRPRGGCVAASSGLVRGSSESSLRFV